MPALRETIGTALHAKGQLAKLIELRESLKGQS